MSWAERAQLIVVDGKNSPDWAKFRLVAHRIVFGTHPNPNDQDPVGNLVELVEIPDESKVMDPSRLQG